MQSDYEEPLVSDAIIAPRRRKLWLAAAAAFAIILAGGTSIALVNAGQPAADNKQSKVIPKTVVVEQTTLKESITAQGVLTFDDTTELRSGFGGTLTHLPEEGAQIGLGQPLYSIDNQPIYLLHGPLPAWRSFQRDMEDGPDVQQLENSLAALGYFSDTPDEEFDWDTENAIERWQDALDVEETGVLDLGRIIFAAGDVRIGERLSDVGTQLAASTPVLKYSSLNKVVNADLKTTDQGLAKVGAQVTVRLPSGQETPGTIAAVGAPRDVEKDGKKSRMIPISISLDDAAATGDVQETSVSVDLPSEIRENVLVVPVTALIALTNGGLGIEVVRPGDETEIKPVNTGLFAGGSVEISGDEIEAGMEVVVPQL